MALIKCKECGKEISEFAATCPNCGCPSSLQGKIDNQVNNEMVKKDTKYDKMLAEIMYCLNNVFKEILEKNNKYLIEDDKKDIRCRSAFYGIPDITRNMYQNQKIVAKKIDDIYNKYGCEHDYEWDGVGQSSYQNFFWPVIEKFQNERDRVEERLDESDQLFYDQIYKDEMSKVNGLSFGIISSSFAANALYIIQDEMKRYNQSLDARHKAADAYMIQTLKSGEINKMIENRLAYDIYIPKMIKAVQDNLNALLKSLIKQHDADYSTVEKLYNENVNNYIKEEQKREEELRKEKQLQIEKEQKEREERRKKEQEEWELRQKQVKVLSQKKLDEILLRKEKIEVEMTETKRALDDCGKALFGEKAKSKKAFQTTLSKLTEELSDIEGEIYRLKLRL